MSTFAFSRFWLCLFSLVAYKPEQKGIGLALGIPMGVIFGWIFPAQRTLLVMLMPPACEAEMMGFGGFASQLLVWLPPLLFVVMNEATGSLRVAVLVAPLLWGVAFAIYFGLDLEEGRRARERAEKSLGDL